MPNEPFKPLIVISDADADEPEKPAEGEVKWRSFVTGNLRTSRRRQHNSSGLHGYALGVNRTAGP